MFLNRYFEGEPQSIFLKAFQVPLFQQLQLLMVLCYLFFIYKLYKIMDGGVYKDASSYGAHGTSRFSREQEIFNNKNFAKDTWNKSPRENLENPSGLIMGLYKKRPVILPEETIIPNRNIFVVGSPGSGKTQSYILTNIIHERSRSIVVTDPKGEIYEATAKLKKLHGYEVRLINFKEMTVSDRYNPVHYIDREIDAEQVATTIVLNAGSEKKKDFWATAEIALLKTLLLYVRYQCPKEEQTLAKCKEILTVHGKTPEDMDNFFEELPQDHPAYQAYLIVRMAEAQTRASIFISLGITLSKFIAKDVQWFTSTNDFTLDEIGKKKIILYCILPVADSTWEPLISCFFTQMFHRLYDVADRNFNRLPVKVNLLLDEFPNLGKIPNYEEILATCRGYGISASTIVQSMGQLIDKYQSKEKAEAIVGNCSLRFLLGVGDQLTADYFSNLIGKTTISVKSRSSSKSKGTNSDSTSSSYTGRSLLTADELMRNTKAVLLVSGMFPFLLDKAFQFQFFKGILNEGLKTSRFEYNVNFIRESIGGKQNEPKSSKLSRHPDYQSNLLDQQNSVADPSDDLSLLQEKFDPYRPQEAPQFEEMDELEKLEAKLLNQEYKK